MNESLKKLKLNDWLVFIFGFLGYKLLEFC